MSIGLHVEYRYFCQILMKLDVFPQIFTKNTQISNFRKVSPVGAELLYSDRRTDRQTWRN